ncbi:hypothetical protein F8M41_026362 [Gigaspora margarita]|uniref:Uncharacterized protein n=1 Tax=Gigaspora margarita TaxID=4874 RepID=A0A8H3XJI0_GIGMA|nr:hypothetical protein F8M41_026362 [Gigaspora margarita]
MLAATKEKSIIDEDAKTSEEIFYKLLDDIFMRAEFIARVNQVFTMPLSEPIKTPNIAIPKGRFSKTKREKLISEKQDLDAKKSKSCYIILS